MKRGAPWTKIEEEFLRDNMHLTYAEVARKLGRPEGGVAEKARRLGLAKRIHKDWSREELSKLRRIYPHKRNKELGEIFGVSEGAIAAKAAVMGLYKKGGVYASIEREVIELRKERLGYKTIASMVGVDRDRVRYICQRNGLAGFVGREPQQKNEDDFAREFEGKFPEFKYVGGYKGSESSFLCACKTCGAVQERSAQVVRPSRDKELQCNNCIETRLKRRELVSAVKRVLKEKERDIRARISPEVEALQRIANGHRYYIECQECGKTFFSNMDRVTCGRSCGKRRDTRRKEIARRERLRTNGKIDWDISLDVLYEKENGVCYLCGDRCNKDDYTINKEGHFVAGPLYPSIDHVTPVSKGGTHTWDNVRLAHHYCNTIKGEKELKIS